jgi:hypothetical protein
MFDTAAAADESQRPGRKLTAIEDQDRSGKIESMQKKPKVKKATKAHTRRA